MWVWWRWLILVGIGLASLGGGRVLYPLSLELSRFLFWLGCSILVGAQAIPAYAGYKWQRRRRAQRTELAAQRADNLAGQLRFFANTARRNAVSLQQNWDSVRNEVRQVLGSEHTPKGETITVDEIEALAKKLKDRARKLRT